MGHPRIDGVTTAEIGRLTDAHRATVWRWVLDGALGKPIGEKGHARFSIEALERHLGRSFSAAQIEAALGPKRRATLTAAKIITPAAPPLTLEAVCGWIERGAAGPSLDYIFDHLVRRLLGHSNRERQARRLHAKITALALRPFSPYL